MGCGGDDDGFGVHSGECNVSDDDDGCGDDDDEW